MPQLSKKMNGALNDQINGELASAYVYLSMSAYCAEANLKGAASWLRIQWEEELEHAKKLFDYIGERGGTVSLKAIAQPPARFKSLLDVFEQVLAHEQAVTASIHKMYDLAVAEKDYASQSFLQWYVNEQVEEENSPAEIISMLRLAGDSGAALLMMDHHLGERTRD
jgi:ferritin